MGGCSSAAAPAIGVDGTVRLGPACPVEREGTPCPLPPGAYDGAEAVARNGEDEVRAGVSPTGHFVLSLPSGTWDVTATAGMSCSTVTVTRTSAITIDCDTGIR
jgi:hypothetical protein